VLFPFPVLGAGDAAAVAPFLSTDHGALIYQSTSTVATPSAVSVRSLPGTAYDPLGMKSGNDTLILPSNPNLTLGRLQGGIATSGGASFWPSHRGRKYDGVSAYAALAEGSSWAQANRNTTGGENFDTFASAIIPLAAADRFQMWVETSASSYSFIQNGSRNWFALEVIKPGTRYCLAHRTSTQTVTAGVTTALSFTSADVADTLGCHDHVGNPSQFVVPADTTGKIRVTAFARSAAANPGTFSLVIELNGVRVAYDSQNLGSSQFGKAEVDSSILSVDPGDVIQVLVNSQTGTGIAAGSWACVEELPANHRYCLLKKSAAQALASPENVAWDVEAHDPEGCHSGSGTTITHPAGVSEYRVTFGITASTAGLFYENTPSGSGIGWAAQANGRPVFNSMSPWKEAVPGWTTALQNFGSGTVQHNTAAGGDAFLQVEWR
jgi:hypothetical protein